MKRAYALIVVLLLAVDIPSVSAQTPSNAGVPDIMTPEQPAPPHKQKRRRGSSSMVYPIPLPKPENFNPPPSQNVVVPRSPEMLPPIAVPETGRVLPNLPMIGSGPGGAETSQDRALRCMQQSGVYGDAAGNRNAYIGSCISQ